MWRWEPTGKGKFQATWIRYVPGPPPFQNWPKQTKGIRLRSMNQFTGPNSFSGSNCVDALDDTGAVIKLGVEPVMATYDAVRMKIAPWHENCQAP